MANILVYVLHYEGAFNKNSLGGVSEAARLASETGGEAHAIVVGSDDLTDDLCGTLGNYGATKVFRVKGPEGLAQPVVDAMAKVIDDNEIEVELADGVRARQIRSMVAEVRVKGEPVKDETAKQN